MSRIHTNNLAIGYGSLRWNDTKQSVKDRFPLALENQEGFIIGNFMNVDEMISMTATVRFSGGELSEIELAPFLGPEIENWKTKHSQLENMFGALAESNERANISVDSDWSDIHVSIRRKPMGH